MRPRSAAHAVNNGHTNGNGSGAHAVAAAEGDHLTQLRASVKLQCIATALENLIVIPGGPIPPNPAELLGSTLMREILDVLEAGADMIVIDTPPALLVTDSIVLADASDGVLLVASATSSTRRQLKKLLAIYDTAGVRVLGSVLNRVRHSRSKSAYYAGYYAAPRKGRPNDASGVVPTIDLRERAQKSAQATNTEPAPQ
jgi:Mrp family chromosome partitioning ATPase